MKRRALGLVAALALAGGACGDDDGSGNGEWCDLARELESETMFDEIDFEDPDSVENAYREVVDILDDAVDSAPDEIKADVQTVLDSTEELVAALEDVDFDLAALEESDLGDQATVDASVRIEAYNERECGIASGDETTDTLFVEGDIDDVDEGAIRDRLVTTFEALGITEDQADCLVDNMDSQDLAAAGDQVDPSMFLHLYETCGIDFDSQLGG